MSTRMTKEKWNTTLMILGEYIEKGLKDLESVKGLTQYELYWTRGLEEAKRIGLLRDSVSDATDALRWIYDKKVEVKENKERETK